MEMPAFEQVLFYEGRKVKANCSDGGAPYRALYYLNTLYASPLNFREEILHREAEAAKP